MHQARPRGGLQVLVPVNVLVHLLGLAHFIEDLRDPGGAPRELRVPLVQPENVPKRVESLGDDGREVSHVLDHGRLVVNILCDVNRVLRRKEHAYDPRHIVRQLVRQKILIKVVVEPPLQGSHDVPSERHKPLVDVELLPMAAPEEGYALSPLPECNVALPEGGLKIVLAPGCRGKIGRDGLESGVTESHVKVEEGNALGPCELVAPPAEPSGIKDGLDGARDEGGEVVAPPLHVPGEPLVHVPEVLDVD
mmetsp:Transcript_2711/g.9346  ORF Transcript_2711/g.9346 Transcript_2711/m.9346 type:complete len:250 (+) Transcript_2711:784-1533(+)